MVVMDFFALWGAHVLPISYQYLISTDSIFLQEIDKEGMGPKGG